MLLMIPLSCRCVEAVVTIKWHTAKEDKDAAVEIEKIVKHSNQIAHKYQEKVIGSKIGLHKNITVNVFATEKDIAAHMRKPLYQFGGLVRSRANLDTGEIYITLRSHEDKGFIVQAWKDDLRHELGHLIASTSNEDTAEGFVKFYKENEP